MNFSIFFNPAPTRSTENQDERIVKKIHLIFQENQDGMCSQRAKKYCSTMIYRDSDSKKPKEVKDIFYFPTSFLTHLERVWKEKD